MTAQEIALRANTIRQHSIRALESAGSGHSAGSLGMADVFAALYFSVVRHDARRPDWDERDRVLLSNGHICPVLYATLAEAGYFPVEELSTLRTLGSKLQGHPHRGALPGLETTSGPLGSGLSQAVGMALGLRMNHSAARVFCLTSDGEHQEGNHWEAVMAAAKYHLSQLVQIIDRNYIQIEGNTEDVMPLDSLAEKYQAFGWNVYEINGHHIQEIIDACDQATQQHEKPSVIIARTMPGKGVSIMEGKASWHGKAPSHDDARQALIELKQIATLIEQNAYDY